MDGISSLGASNAATISGQLEQNILAARIDRFLESSIQLPLPPANPWQVLHTKLDAIAKQGADRVAGLEERLNQSARENELALTRVSAKFAEASAKGDALLARARSNLAALQQEKDKFAAMHQRLQILHQNSSRDCAYLKQQLDAELHAQRVMQGEIRQLEIAFHNAHAELGRLQSGLGLLQAEQALAAADLLELDRQILALQRHLAAIEKGIQEVKDRNANCTMLLAAVGVAAIAIGAFIIVNPASLAAGVAAGDEIAFGLVLTSQGASLTLTTLGGAVASGVVLTSSKCEGSSARSRTYQPREENPPSIGANPVHSDLPPQRQERQVQKKMTSGARAQEPVGLLPVRVQSQSEAKAWVKAVGSDVKHLTPDGSIEPLSDSILSLLNLRKSPCKKASAEGIHAQPCPTALVLTANTDHNGAFDLTLFSGAGNVIAQTYIFKKLEAQFDTSYARISNVKEMCQVIDAKKAQGVAVDLLILRAHGSQYKMALDRKESLSVGDFLPTDSCLKNLAPDVRIVVNGCSTGRGRNTTGVDNVARYIARHAPAEAKIYAPVEDSLLFDFTKDALDFEFVCLPRGAWQTPLSLTRKNMTFKIDNATKTPADRRVDEVYLEDDIFKSQVFEDLRPQAGPITEKEGAQKHSFLWKVQSQVSESHIEGRSGFHFVESVVEHVVGSYVLKKVVGRKSPLVHYHQTAHQAKEKDRGKGSPVKGTSTHVMHEVLGPEHISREVSSSYVHSQVNSTRDLISWSTYIESPEYFFKENELEKIAVVRNLVALSDAAAFAVSAAAYPFMEGMKHTGVMAHDVCSSHPSVNRQCQKIAGVFKSTKDFYVDAILQQKELAIFASQLFVNKILNARPFIDRGFQSISEMWIAGADNIAAWKEKRSFAIAKVALENERRYGIPQDMTFHYYADGEELITTAVITGAVSIAGKVAQPFLKQEKRVWSPKGLQGQILPSGDIRGLEAKDVTPTVVPRLTGTSTPIKQLSGPRVLYGEILLPGDARGAGAKNVSPLPIPEK